jgi:site-specific recombinase XerD
MTSENPLPKGSQDPESASENTPPLPPGRRGRAPVALDGAFAEVLAEYVAALAAAPLSPQTRRTYASKARQYLAWLAGAPVDGDPLASTDGRDWAVRDYRSHLQVVAKRSPATVNNALAAVDDFYLRRGLGPAAAARVDIPAAAPRALDRRAQVRYLRAVEACASPRDQALALVPFYAGARIAEIVGLDVDDVARSARKGVLRIYGKGQRLRLVPIHPQLQRALADWLTDRADWPGADGPALFLNQRGGRLSVRGAHDIITGIASRAALDDGATAHILRHTFATTLVRGGTDLVLVAELLGHARLETTRGYSRPSAEDRVRALDLLVVDE